MAAQKKPFWMTILRRRGPMLFNNFVIFGQGRPYFQEMLGFDFEIRNFKYIDGEITIDVSEVGELGKLVGENIEQNPAFLGEFLERCNDQSNALLALSSEISSLSNLSSLTEQELKNWFVRYSEQVMRMMPFLNIFAVMDRDFSERISTELRPRLAARGKEELPDQYLADLIFPPKDNYVVKALDELITIGADIQQKPNLMTLFEKSAADIEKALEQVDAALFSKLQEHATTFGFLNMYTYEGSPMTVLDVIARIKELLREDCTKKREEIERRREEVRQEYKKILKDLDISGSLLELIEYAQEYLYFRLYRLDVLFIAGCHVRGFLEEIARRMGLEYNDIIQLWHKEIIDFLDKGVLPPGDKIIEERKRGYATLFIDGELQILSGSALNELLAEREKEEKDYSAVQEMEGAIASPGKHEGVARIVLTASDTEKVQRGDVLVSTMTNPYYVPAMIRAGAIVTDEGGILSHAAIVSRELLKPCVIGTEIATRSLNDGDQVEVDATGPSGVVRILWRA